MNGRRKVENGEVAIQKNGHNNPVTRNPAKKVTANIPNGVHAIMPKTQSRFAGVCGRDDLNGGASLE